MASLHENIAILAQLGLPLGPGVTEAQLIGEDEVEWYEEMDALLEKLGTGDEDGNRLCHWAQSFDLECIYSASDYVDVVEALCALAGASNALTNVRAELTDDEAMVEYSAGGKPIRHSFERIDDWMDGEAIESIGDDIALLVPGKRFYVTSNGQFQVVYCMSPEAASRLKALGATCLPGVA